MISICLNAISLGNYFFLNWDLSLNATAFISKSIFWLNNYKSWWGFKNIFGDP